MFFLCRPFSFYLNIPLQSFVSLTVTVNFAFHLCLVWMQYEHFMKSFI